jgi:hypothetical protein
VVSIPSLCAAWTNGSFAAGNVFAEVGGVGGGAYDVTGLFRVAEEVAPGGVPLIDLSNSLRASPSALAMLGIFEEPNRKTTTAMIRIQTTGSSHAILKADLLYSEKTGSRLFKRGVGYEFALYGHMAPRLVTPRSPFPKIVLAGYVFGEAEIAPSVAALVARSISFAGLAKT